MNPFRTFHRAREDYRAYVETFQRFKDERIREFVRKQSEEGDLLWKEPLVEITRQYKRGQTLKSLVDNGVLEEEVLSIFTSAPNDPNSRPVHPYHHQTESIRITLSEKKNLIVATGTGSGKSFCFGIPIVNACVRLRKEETPGVKAVIIYPMNALANSQYDDFAGRLKGTGLTIARYTGELAHSPEDALSQFQKLYHREPYDSEIISRREIQLTPPDILMTNYVQLELLLTRLEDKQIFRDSHLEFIVLDEIHTYGGKRGTDVALLLRRLKQRTGTIGKVCCIGTSATMHSDDAEEESAAVAAKFAQKLFGEPFDKSCYVAETEEHLAEYQGLDALPDEIRVTRKMVDDFDENSRKSLQVIASALCGRELTQGDVEPQALYKLLSGHPTLHFLEHQLAEKPTALNELTERYIVKLRKGANPAAAQAELETALILGSLARSPDESGKLVPRFMPKLHTFFTQGKELRRCLAPDCYYLDDRGATTCPSCSQEGNPAWLFPIHFCRVCGQDYYGFGVDADGTVIPFSIFDEEPPTNPGYFMLREEELTEDQLPEDWLTPGGKIKKKFQNHIPGSGCLNLKTSVFADSGDGVKGIWIPAPFLWCPNCDMTYDRVPREFSKLFLLNTIGRATGANVLIQGTMLESPRKRGSHLKS